MMFGLKKIFSFRNKTAGRFGAWEDQEKPFLDHLEDLRIMLFKVIVTLLIAIVGCFAMHKQLFSLVLKPMELAQLDESDLPDGVMPKRWSMMKYWADTAGSLYSSQARDAYLQKVRTSDEILINDLYKGWNKDASAAVKFEVLFETAQIYRAADSLRLNREKKDTRGDAPVDFFENAGSAEAAALAVKLWEVDARADISMLATKLEMQVHKPAEPFMMSMKLAFYAALVVSLPFLLYFLAEFILPGLSKRERKALLPAFAFGAGLFVTGVLFAFLIVVPRALGFFYHWGGDLDLLNQWRVGEYISFVTQMTLIFGLAFELPVVILTIVKLGLLDVKALREGRIWAYALILVGGGILTPTPDMFTLSLLAGPLVVLFELTILVAWVMEAKSRKKARSEEAEYKRWLEQRLTPAVDEEDDSNGNPPPKNPQSVAGLSPEPQIKPRSGIVPAVGSYPQPVARRQLENYTTDPSVNESDATQETSGSDVDDGDEEIDPKDDFRMVEDLTEEERYKREQADDEASESE